MLIIICNFSASTGGWLNLEFSKRENIQDGSLKLFTRSVPMYPICFAPKTISPKSFRPKYLSIDFYIDSLESVLSSTELMLYCLILVDTK